MFFISVMSLTNYEVSDLITSNNEEMMDSFKALLQDTEEETFCVPDIVNPLSVSTRSSGQQRLILDLRHVNRFIFKQKFNVNVKT